MRACRLRSNGGVAYRVDIGSLRPAKRLADGRLRAEGWVSRAGVFVYRDSDGKERREYRPPDEVFHSDALGSFACVPVTDDHPPESLTAKNARRFTVGMIGESIRRDGDHVAAALTIFDDATISKMESGKVQLSCGYVADVVAEAGVTADGERYDAVQRNIRGNHVALVDVARAGPTACVRMDAAVMVIAGETGSESAQERITMTLEQALAALATAQEKLGAEKARADAATTEVATMKTRADRADAERDSAKEALAAAEKARTDAADSVLPRVRARVALETAAKPILGAELKLDGLADREIKIAVVKKATGVDIAADKSDDYVGARFDAEIERLAKAGESRSELRTVLDAAAGSGGAADAGDAARARMVERNRNAYKTAGETAGQQGG